MKPLPLQMQQNLILAVTLLGGVIFAPHNIAPSHSNGLENGNGDARLEASYSTAVSLAKRPVLSSDGERSPAAAEADAGDITLRIPRRPLSEGKLATRRESGVVLPRAVLGDWTWSSSDSRSQTAFSRFRFSPDGRYVYQYVLRQSSRGRVVDSTTVEEGTVTFRTDGTFEMFPARGYVRGNTGNGFENRPMDPVELGKRTFHWGWRGEGGERKLYLGPSERSASGFVPAC